MPRYPFDPETLDAIPEQLTRLYRGLEIDLLEKICSQLRISGSLNESAMQAIRALRSQGISLTGIRKAIEQTARISEQRLDDIFRDVEAQNSQYYGNVAEFAQLTVPGRFANQSDIDAIYEQTHSELKNITQSMGFVVSDGAKQVALPPADAYQWALDKAVIKVQSGVYSYDKAISDAVKQLADSGLRTVQYGSGHVEQIDTAVRRAVMTGVGQLNAQYREASMDYIGTDLVECTAHYGARNIQGPNKWDAHTNWQGKVFRWNEKPRTSKGEYPDFIENCGYGHVTGIIGANCRHDFFAYFEGISERTYTDDDLEKMKPENRPKIKFRGKEYDDYTATQYQRKIESTVRKMKREEAAFRAVGNNQRADETVSRIRQLNNTYREFCKAAGLRTQFQRMRVYDLGK